MDTLFSILQRSSFFQEEMIKFDVPMKNITSFKVGGNAKIFFTPKTHAQLEQFLIFCNKNNIPLDIIGGGKNLLVSDNGFKGAVLNLKEFNSINIIKEEDDVFFVKVESGCLINDFTKWAIDKSFSGIENFGGLPGTVGGALFMNASCYGSSISDTLYKIEYLNFNGNSCTFDEYFFNTVDWGYKSSPFQEHALGTKITINRKIILSAVFKLQLGNKNEIKEKTNNCLKDRINKGHFKAPSAGSTFKNNKNFGYPVGKIIDDAGLCGLSFGGAQVATWHGNFIINKNNASAKDLRALINKVQEIIFIQKGINLEPEVIFAGDWD